MTLAELNERVQNALDECTTRAVKPQDVSVTIVREGHGYDDIDIDFSDYVDEKGVNKPTFMIAMD